MTSEFSRDERVRARAYHRPLYLALLADLALSVGLLGALAWSSVGDWLFSPLESLPSVAAAAAYAALVTACSSVLRTPLACWRGWWRERRWAFSTQGVGGWLGDRGKGLAVSVVLGAGAWAAAVALARELPGWWALPAGAALALAVLLLSFVAPVVLEPLFNRFRPL
jgi:STE24 endopeptidase